MPYATFIEETNDPRSNLNATFAAVGFAPRRFVDAVPWTPTAPPDHESPLLMTIAVVSAAAPVWPPPPTVVKLIEVSTDPLEWFGSNTNMENPRAALTPTR